MANILFRNANMPNPVNDLIMNEFNKLKEMSGGHPDYSIFLNYVSYVVNLPWNKTTEESLDLEKAKKVQTTIQSWIVLKLINLFFSSQVLELNHYGMDKVKNRILQFIAVRIMNPQRRGPILCFIGPPGVGKTTIAKTIADSLNRTFKRFRHAFIRK